MVTQKHTILWIPGAWHSPAHYEPTAKLLREAGYETVMISHPSVGIDSDPGSMLTRDAINIAKKLRALLDEGKDVVLVMHSYGGIAGSEAVAMVCEEHASDSNSNTGRIRRLVYLAAHVLEKGMSFFGSGGPNPPKLNIDERGLMVPNNPHERYYNDISLDEAKPALDMLRPMASSVFSTETSFAGWKDYGIPCTYIPCLQDIGLPKALTDRYISRLRDAGVDTSVEKIDASHSASWTAPEKLAEVLEKSIEE